MCQQRNRHRLSHGGVISPYALVADLCALGETAQADERRDFPAPAASDLTALIDKAPPMQGDEYLQRALTCLDGAR